MRRLTPTQEQALLALLLQRREQPFAWGARDCCLLAADAVQRLTGRDPAHDLRGTYASAGQAVRVLRQFGGLAGLVSSRVGTRLAREDAGDGAIAIVDSTRAAGRLAGHGALGLVWKGRIVAQGGSALVGLPLADAVSFWQPSDVMPEAAP
jgi:hypothetical protein